MRKLQILGAAALAVAALTLSACDKDAAAGASNGESAKDVQAIKDGETQWVADLKARDLEKVVSHYASDGTLMIPGETSTHGADMLRWAFKRSFEDPSYSLAFKPDRVEVAAAGDLAYSQGTFTLTASDPTTHQPQTVKGAYVTVYRKAANGTWRALEDIATPTAPGGAPVAAAAAKPPSGEVDAAKEADSLRALETSWGAAWKARDVNRIAAVYAPDAAAMQPGVPMMGGTAAIQAGLTQALKDPAFTVEFKPDTVVVSASGDLAYTRGAFTQTATDPKTNKPVQQKGSYVTVYRRQADGSWKAVADIATPGPPTPAAATVASN